MIYVVMYLLCGFLWILGLMAAGIEKFTPEYTKKQKVFTFSIAVVIWPLAVIGDLLIGPLTDLIA